MPTPENVAANITQESLSMRKSSRILNQKSIKKELENEYDKQDDSLFDTEYLPITKKMKRESSELLDDSNDEYFPSQKKTSHKQQSKVLSDENQDGLSDYEKMVQANIEQRMQFLKELNINEAKISLQKLKPPQNKSFKDKLKKPVIKPTERRKSSRLQKIDAIDYSRHSFEKKEIGFGTETEEEPALPDPGPKELQNYYKLDDLDESSAFIDSLKRLKLSSSDHPWSEEAKILKMAFNSMENNEALVAKVVPGRIYSLRIHPTTDKLLIFAGDKFGQLGIWDAHQENASDNIFYYKIHSAPINCMSIDKFEHNNLHTNSYDGSLRRVHLASSIVEQLYKCDDNFYISWHAQKDAHSFVVAGSNGLVDCVDIRVSQKAVRRYPIDTNKSVKVITAHPVENNLMATASSDGNVCLWDLRKMTRNPISKIIHGRTVSGLEFSPVSGKLLLSTCADDSLRLMKMESGTLRSSSVIRHNNHTGRWLTTFKANWLPESENHFVVGSMDYPRKIEIWDANCGKRVHSFQSEFLQSVTSINTFHPHKKVLAGGNSSGRVFIFLDKTES